MADSNTDTGQMQEERQTLSTSLLVQDAPPPASVLTPTMALLCRDARLILPSVNVAVLVNARAWLGRCDKHAPKASARAASALNKAHKQLALLTSVHTASEGIPAELKAVAECGQAAAVCWRALEPELERDLLGERGIVGDVSGFVEARGRGRKRARLRSRNAVIDRWLGSETGGDDAYADLEDFIADEDE